MTKTFRPILSLMLLMVGLLTATSANAFSPWQASIANQTQDGCITCLTVNISSLNNFNLSSVDWEVGGTVLATSSGPFVGIGNTYILQECLEFPGNGNQTLTLIVSSIDPTTGFATIDEIDIVVTVAQECELDVDFAYCIDDCEVCFENLTTHNSCTVPNYFWDFGDGGNSSDESPCHQYAMAGTYEVTLFVTDNTEQCFESITKTIIVNEGCEAECMCEITSVDISLVSGPNGCDYVFGASATGTGCPGFEIRTAWNFGDDVVISAPGNAISYTIPQSGTYPVTVIYTLSDPNDPTCQFTLRHTEIFNLECEGGNSFMKSGDSGDGFMTSEVNVFPNPGADLITLTYSSDISIPGTARVINNMGATIASYPILPNTNNSIDVSTLSAGSYYIIIEENPVILTAPIPFHKIN